MDEILKGIIQSTTLQLSFEKQMTKFLVSCMEAIRDGHERPRWYADEVLKDYHNRVENERKLNESEHSNS
jgi:hypothetical protein